MLNKINLQYFGEGSDDGDDAGTKTPPKATGKVWTDDYVQSLREEAKNHRIRAKSAEATLRSLLGLNDGEEITDTKIAAYKQKIAAEASAAVEKANARLISAEIKGLSGYDAKLVDRLIDRSKIKVDESGAVIGLKDALDALSTEFPQIKTTTGTPPAGDGTPPPAGGNPPTKNSTRLAQLEEQLAKATTLEQKLTIKREIFEVQKKGE
jgi:hypothetical protein